MHIFNSLSFLNNRHPVANDEKSEAAEKLLVCPFKRDTDPVTQTTTSLQNDRKVLSIVHLSRLPYLQLSSMAFSSPDKPKRFSSPISFADWTKEMREKALQSLQNLNSPLKASTLELIYKIIQSNQKHYCNRLEESNYPALFKGAAAEIEESSPSPTPEFITFELEVHSDKKIHLLFREHEATHIGNGSFKEIIKAFPLGKPKKVFSYSYTNIDKIKNLSDVNQIYSREEKFLTQCNGKNFIVKVYDIYYYRVKSFLQQIITMKYYPDDLLKLLISPKRTPLSDQIKIKYSIELVKAVMYLHQEGIIHRDIKVDNILVSPKEINLTDFGLACRLSDPEISNRTGSLPYIAPEFFFWKTKKGTPIDVWSIACTLWLLWAEEGSYPWHGKASKENPDSKSIVDRMRQFDLNPPDPDLKLLCILWNMLRFLPTNRISLKEALTSLEELANALSKEPTFDLTCKFHLEINEYKKSILARQDE